MSAVCLAWRDRPRCNRSWAVVPRTPMAYRYGACSDRDGPFAAAAAPVADGLRDYLAMINARDGGVNGIALVYEECDAGFAAEDSAACYDKARATAIVDTAVVGGDRA